MHHTDIGTYYDKAHGGCEEQSDVIYRPDCIGRLLLTVAAKLVLKELTRRETWMFVRPEALFYARVSTGVLLSCDLQMCACGVEHLWVAGTGTSSGICDRVGIWVGHGHKGVLFP